MQPVYLEQTTDDGEAIAVATQWNDSYQEKIISFTNTINIRYMCAHLSGSRAALTRTIPALPSSFGLANILIGEPLRRSVRQVHHVEPVEGRERKPRPVG